MRSLTLRLCAPAVCALCVPQLACNVLSSTLCLCAHAVCAHAQVVVKTCTLTDWHAFNTFCKEVRAHARLRGKERFMQLEAASLDLDTGKGVTVMKKMDCDLWDL